MHIESEFMGAHRTMGVHRTYTCTVTLLLCKNWSRPPAVQLLTVLFCQRPPCCVFRLRPMTQVYTEAETKQNPKSRPDCICFKGTNITVQVQINCFWGGKIFATSSLQNLICIENLQTMTTFVIEIVDNVLELIKSTDSMHCQWIIFAAYFISLNHLISKDLGIITSFVSVKMKTGLLCHHYITLHLTLSYLYKFI